MAIIKCKMCGGDLELLEDSSVCECEYCGTKQTVPKVDDEKKLKLFERANRLRTACEFDKAAGVYETIVADFDQEAEAYWGLILCKFGIEYVDDPATGRKIPTCHRSSFESLMDDPNFEMVMECADPIARRVYRDEAKQIEELRKSIIEVSSKEEPYDVFISYKELAEDGQRTLDSVIAQDIYTELTDKGYRVFFSRISLESKLGVEYEPYIFAALNSARVMLVVGTDYDYFNAVWVKNEWSRFLALMAKGEKKVLIPVFKGIDAYDMPKEFNKLAAQDMGKVGAMQDLVRGVEKIIGKKKPEPAQQAIYISGGPNAAALLERGKMALEESNWEKANQFFDQVLNMDAHCAEAYLGLAMAKASVRDRDALGIWYEEQNESGWNVNRQNIIRARHFSEEIDRWFARLEEHIQERERARQITLREIEKRFPTFDGSKQSLVSVFVSVMGEILKKEESKTLSDALRNDYFIQFGTLNRKTLDSEQILSELIVPETVTGIGACAFQDCMNLQTILLPDGLKEIGMRAFFGCKELKDLDLPQGLVKLGQEAFRHCTSLNNVVIPESVESIGALAFENCSELHTVKLPNGLTIIRTATFRGCADLSSVKLPDGLIEIRAEAFMGCTNLRELVLPNSVKRIEPGAFMDCENLVLRAYTKNTDAKDYAEAYNIRFEPILTEAERIAAEKAEIDRIAREKRAEEERIAREKKAEEERIARLRRLEELKQKRALCASVRNLVSVGKAHTVGLKAAGTVLAVGQNYDGQCEVSGWTDMVAVSAGGDHTVGLRADGTVLAVGKNDDGRCKVSGWTDVVAVSAGGNHTVGLRADGTVMAVGSNKRGQCEVSGWTNVVAVAAGGDHTVGLRADGTVIAVGKTDSGQCKASGWTDVVAVSAGRLHTVGLRADGTVVAVGVSLFGRCKVSDWTDVVAVAAGGDHTVGLRADGTVLAVGYNQQGQCKVSGWADVVAIAAGDAHTVGLRADGTVLAVGKTYDGQCRTSDWKLFDNFRKLTSSEEKIKAWKDARRKSLTEERAKLQAELPTIKGLFVGSKKAKIEVRLAQIEEELKTLG